MTGRGLVITAVAVAIGLAAAASAWAQDAPPPETAPAAQEPATPGPTGEAPPPPPAPEQGVESPFAPTGELSQPQPPPQPPPPPPPPAPAASAEVRPLSSAADQLSCARAVCRCEPGVDPSTGASVPCATVACQCEAPPPPPSAEQSAAASRAATLDRPVGTNGFLVEPRHVGLRLEAGFPAMVVELLHGAHRRVTWGVGYKNVFYTIGHAGYGLVRVLVAENQRRSVAFSLTGTIGYTFLREDYPEYRIMNGDSVSGELLASLSYRRGRNAFDLLAGLRLGWIRTQECNAIDEWDDCWGDYVFAEGRAGLLATVIFDFGWTIRISRSLGYYLAAGFESFTNVDEFVPINYRMRTGLLFDF